VLRLIEGSAEEQEQFLHPAQLRLDVEEDKY
jgi:hypothetical protein